MACGAPPRRPWPAPVGCVLAGQPVSGVGWAAAAAAAADGRVRRFGLETAGPLRGCPLELWCASPACARFMPRGAHARPIMPRTPFIAQPMSPRCFTRLSMPPRVRLSCAHSRVGPSANFSAPSSEFDTAVLPTVVALAVDDFSSFFARSMSDRLRFSDVSPGFDRGTPQARRALPRGVPRRLASTAMASAGRS